MNEKASPTAEALSYGMRIAAAAEALNETPETFQALFDSRIGLDTIEDLDSELFKFGDFLKKFEDKPIGRVRKAFSALKGGKVEKNEVCGGPEDPRLAQLRDLGYKTKISDAPTPLLLSLYRPELPNDPVTQALKARFGSEPVIAFNDDGSVNSEATTEYASGIEQGFPKSDTVNVNGRLVKLWPVGVKPDVMVDEDPLVPGSPLRNGVSVVNHRNWSKVEFAERQFCRLVLEHGDINADNHEAVLRLLERAQAKTLVDAYPEVDLLFREKQKRSELPKLRIPLGQSTRPQNPFGVKRQY